MKNCEIKGIIPPILTPMNNDDNQAVNHAELRNQVERLLAGGVHGLFPFGTNGDEVRVDKFAHDADAVIVVGRIKAHNAFRGQYESGLIKMMAIGMGKRAGADSLHSAGFGEMGVRPMSILYDNAVRRCLLNRIVQFY